jgi:hypothetical protein
MWWKRYGFVARQLVNQGQVVSMDVSELHHALGRGAIAPNQPDFRTIQTIESHYRKTMEI